MLASVAAWHWLDNDCISHILAVVSNLEGASGGLPADTWLADLTAEVYRAVVNNVPVQLQAEDFVPYLAVKHPQITISPKRKPGTIERRVCEQVIAVVSKLSNSIVPSFFSFFKLLPKLGNLGVHPTTSDSIIHSFIELLKWIIKSFLNSYLMG